MSDSRAGAALVISFTLLLPVLAPHPAASALPPGYFVDTEQARASRHDRWEATEWELGDFTISIRRKAPDPHQARLLAIAESTYPPRDLVASVALLEGYDMGSDVSRGNLWWYQGAGPNRLPYAVTLAAIDYYAGLTESFRRSRFWEAGTRPLYSSRLVYEGAIAHRDRFTVSGEDYHDVYVAHLHLVWGWDDGIFDSFTEATRTVVLDRAGDVLAVSGDRPFQEDVVISGWRDRVGREPNQ
ncbi:MAG TPA: hypothetical protein VFP58_14030 [Candidatus Eisenbacteria bacterium]|nr:hypothetical protein [Candidatus Eisenbacteria bacterium]